MRKALIGYSELVPPGRMRMTVWPEGRVHLRIEDLGAVAQEFDNGIIEQPWGREVHLVDPDGNRLRIGEAAPNP
jgi:hypothetical protein